MQRARRTTMKPKGFQPQGPAGQLTTGELGPPTTLKPEGGFTFSQGPVSGQCSGEPIPSCLSKGRPAGPPPRAGGAGFPPTGKQADLARRAAPGADSPTAAPPPGRTPGPGSQRGRGPPAHPAPARACGGHSGPARPGPRGAPHPRTASEERPGFRGTSAGAPPPRVPPPPSRTCGSARPRPPRTLGAARPSGARGASPRATLPGGAPSRPRAARRPAATGGRPGCRRRRQPPGSRTGSES